MIIKSNSIVLVLYRCPPSDTSAVFWDQDLPPLMLDRSHHALGLPVFAQIESLLRCVDAVFRKTHAVSCAVAVRSIVFACVDRLVCAAYANFQRSLAAPTTIEIVKLVGKDLFREISQAQKLIRQIQAFNYRYPLRAEPDFGNTACRVLANLMQDLQQLEALGRAQEVSTSNNYLGRMIEDQTTETKESTKTSIQIGRLSRLAYVFLPLQITTSLLGMNLELFGSGSLSMRTFIGILVGLCLLSFLPIVPHERVSQCFRLWQYSSKVSVIYTCFCATHASAVNDLLWDSGISWDVKYFSVPGWHKRNTLSPSPDEVWLKQRHKLVRRLSSDRLSFFPTFWQEKLKEVFKIIDKPQWGREKLHNP